MKKDATPKSSDQQQSQQVYQNNESRADIFHMSCLYWMEQAESATHTLKIAIQPCTKSTQPRLKAVLKQIAIQHKKVVELIECKDYISARLAMYHIENKIFSDLNLITHNLPLSRKEKIESAAFNVFAHFSNAARQLGSIYDPNGAIPFRAKGVR